MKTTENAVFLFLPELGLSQFREFLIGFEAERKVPTLNYIHFAERIHWEAQKKSTIRAQLELMVRPFIGEIELRPEGMSALMLAVFDSPNGTMLINDGFSGYHPARVAQVVRSAARPPTEIRKMRILRALDWCRR